MLVNGAEVFCKWNTYYWTLSSFPLLLFAIQLKQNTTLSSDSECINQWNNWKYLNRLKDRGYRQWCLLSKEMWLAHQ